MFVIKKNQVVITALVVMIAAAGYLNYIDSVPSGTSEVMLTDADEAAGLVQGEVGDGSNFAQSEADENVIAMNTEEDIESAALENDDSTAVNEADAASGDDAGTAVFVNSSDDSSYFVQAKLEREQSRSKQKDLLNEMLNNEQLGTENKNEVTTAMLEIQQRIEKETAAEAMIEAKGFKEAYVRIDDDTVDVVVEKAQLTEAELAQIEDIVKRKTGVSAEKIRITPLKK